MNRKISYPSHEVPMRKWWAGIYKHVFIAPYPFFQIKSVLENDNYIPTYDDVKRGENLPDNFDDIIKQHGTPITWHEMHMAIEPNIPKIEFYRAVWLLSCIGFQERAGVKLQKTIDNYCRDNKIFLPEDDAISAILHPPLMQFLNNFKQFEIVAWDEFREHSTVLNLVELSQKNLPTI